MAKVRSPNYPLMSLGPALDAIRPAFKNENRNKMSRSVLAKHMGYNSLNGRALGKIGAVRAYGLIDGSGDELRISDDAIKALMAPTGSNERLEALARLAARPILFRELNKEFPTMPSIDNVKYNLIKRGFTPDAAEKAAKSYLATFNLVGGIQDEYNPSDADSEAEEEMQPEITNPPRPKPLRELVGPLMLREVFNLEEGAVTLEYPATLSADSYQDLSDYLELFLRKAKRRAEKGDEEAAN